MLSTMTLVQTVLSGPAEKLNRRIQMTILSENELAPAHLVSFDHSLPVGISAGFTDSGAIASLAFVDERSCLIIELTSKNKLKSGDRRSGSPQSPAAPAKGMKLLEEALLCRTSGALCAFDMSPLTMSLYFELGLRVTNAIDIQSAFTTSDRKPLTAVKAALGAEPEGIKVIPENVNKIFLYTEYDTENRSCKTELAARAWTSQFLVTDCTDREILEKLPRIDTLNMDENRLQILAKLGSDAHRVSHLKPLHITHQFTAATRDSEGNLRLSAANYKDKFRGEKNVKVRYDGARGSYTTHGALNAVEGRTGVVNGPLATSAGVDTVLTVQAFGRDEPTMAEAQRAATILRVLQGNHALLDENPWIRNIWPIKNLDDDVSSLKWPAVWSSQVTTAPQLRKAPNNTNGLEKIPRLNSSQQKAVNSMLASNNDQHRLILVQGPPGTGKTSVIAAYVLFAVQQGLKGIWLVAQSNVAVKNIAEKLIAVGFQDWKLLVSKDFHFEWHEHLYTQIKDHIIRSEQFKFIGSKQLKGCRVILCTLSILSNYFIKNFTRCIPLNSLIIDEASQIEIGNYIPVFDSFASTLRKVCFIGDNKQLPPHGEEDIKDLQSIFEVQRLQKNVIFLDTQYRMPPQIGEIISSEVYDEKLKSNPLHPVSNSTPACYFIDVPGGKESMAETSWKNVAEQDVTLKLAQHLQDAEMGYKIITPYDGQTREIENRMKATTGLKWGDTCFNVDAFQGNEEDYIIISLVRSQKLGFLTNLRRTNVMLTRCKRGMFIITSKKFLFGPGESCLVAEMEDYFDEKFGEQIWLSVEDIEKGKIGFKV